MTESQGIKFNEDECEVTFTSMSGIHNFIASLSFLGMGAHVDKVIITPIDEVTEDMAIRWSEGIRKIQEAIGELDAMIHDDMGGCF